jgi:hypothetical protein
VSAITPATLLRYCQQVYDAMELSAKDGVWEGRTTELLSRLHISNAHYSRVVSTLVDTGSIELLQRGARNALTRYQLHFRLSGDNGVQVSDSALTEPTAFDRLSARVSGLERRLEGIDVKTYLANVEKRVQSLEAKANK